jgi:hypothetical protein
MSSSNGTPTTRLTTDLSKLTATNQDSSVAASSNAGDDLDAADTKDQQGTDNQMSSWTGWAELENDPLIFATLLKEWGVPNIQVNEVVPLESVLNHPS